MGDKADETQDRAPTDGGPDASPNLEQPSSVDELTSTIDKDRTYSGADVTKMFSDWAAKEGRVALTRAETAETEAKRATGELTGLTTRFDTLSAQMDDILKGREDAERDALKDQPEKLSVLDGRLANAKEARRLGGLLKDIDAKQALLESSTAEAGKVTARVAITAAASRAGVSEKALADLVPDGDAGRLATAADLLKKSGSEADRGAGTKDKPAGLSQRPVSAQRAPGTDPSGMSSEDKIAAGLGRKKKG